MLGTLKKYYRTLFTLEQWHIGWARVNIETFLRDPSVVALTWITPKSIRTLLADPFGIERHGKLHIIAERMVQGPSQGEIVLVDPVAWAGPPRLVLKTHFHLSYPFVVRDGDQSYVVPEQGASRTLCFYRLLEESESLYVDPSPAAVLADLDAIDPTLLFQDQRWWLFCTRNFAPDTDAPLLLFHAKSLLGPYTAHPSNPIVTDRGRARSAGRIIRIGNRLIRPAQDSSHTYGGAIVLNEIVRLTPTDYEERPIGRIEPSELSGAWRDGTHHLDHTDSYVLIDSKRITFYPFAWLIRLRLRWRARRKERE